MKSLLGRPLDSLALRDRKKLTGKWIALEIYTPETLPVRTLEAIGDSARECIEQLRERNLDPARFEFTLLPPPY